MDFLVDRALSGEIFQAPALEMPGDSEAVAHAQYVHLSNVVIKNMACAIFGVNSYGEECPRKVHLLTVSWPAGCSAALAVLVEVTEQLHIPSAFSPNSDGLNDAWVIPNIRSFPNCVVSIYNRWGELVFFSAGYPQPWDGTYQQTRVPTGVYTYQIRTGDQLLDTTYRGQLMIVW